MATRQQSIGVRDSTPRELNAVFQRLWSDLAKLQERIDEVSRLVSTGTAGGASSVVAQLQQQVAQIQRQITALQGSADPDLVPMRLDGPTGAGVPVYPTGVDRVSQVDPSDPLTVSTVLGLTTVSGEASEIVPVRRFGPMTVFDVVLEPGRSVYVSAAGGLTQDTSYSTYAIPLGVALTESAMFVRPELPLLLRESVYSSPHDDAMPVTLGMLRNLLEPLLNLLEQPDGIVTKVGDELLTRVLVSGSGSGILIENGDGFDGDPTFSLE